MEKGLLAILSFSLRSLILGQDRLERNIMYLSKVMPESNCYMEMSSNWIARDSCPGYVHYLVFFFFAVAASSAYNERIDNNVNVSPPDYEVMVFNLSTSLHYVTSHYMVFFMPNCQTQNDKFSSFSFPSSSHLTLESIPFTSSSQLKHPKQSSLPLFKEGTNRKANRQSFDWSSSKGFEQSRCKYRSFQLVIFFVSTSVARLCDAHALLFTHLAPPLSGSFQCLLLS